MNFSRVDYFIMSWGKSSTLSNQFLRHSEMITHNEAKICLNSNDLTAFQNRKKHTFDKNICLRKFSDYLMSL